MANFQRRNQKRSQAKAILNELFSNSKIVNVIHYSCESFYDRTNGKSPRITSIAVRNLDTAQTTSFSIHQIAELQSLGLNQIDQNYDALELQMLDNFCEFVNRHPAYKWLHWNMRDINYGFAAIEHRYHVLGGKKKIEVLDSQLVDLARVLIDLYSPNYIGHPRLEKLIEKNNISRRDFLSGKEEAEAFENKQYVKLHQSTLRKVDIIANIAERELDDRLKTDAKWRDIYGSNIRGYIDAAMENPITKILGLLGIIITVVTFIPWLIDVISKIGK